MVEAAVSAVIAALTGIVAVHTRIGSRINEVDRRIDQVELRIAESYIKREEFAAAVKKMEDHMIRIENKIDQIALKNA